MNVLRFVVLVATLVANVANANEAYVGDTKIVIPTPTGFAKVTPDIQPLYDVSMDMLAPTNTRLVTFVDEAIIPAALAGEMPVFERYINVETARALATRDIAAWEFAELRRTAKEQIEEAIRNNEQKLREAMGSIGESVGETLDVDMAMSINNIVPLPVHRDSQNVVSNSMYAKYQIDAGGGTTDIVVSATTSFVMLKNKLVYVYVYGGPTDIEWTREFSARWIDEILAANPFSASSRSTVPGGSAGRFDWGRVLEKAVGGALIGGVVALLFGLPGLLRRRRKKTDDVLFPNQD